MAKKLTTRRYTVAWNEYGVTKYRVVKRIDAAKRLARETKGEWAMHRVAGAK